ncbi:Kelch-like protein 18 [Sparganum proliferum]
MAETVTFVRHGFSQFTEICNRRELCDFALEVDGRTYFAHKVILAASIPYFEELLHASDYDEKDIASLPPSSETLEALLTFAYSGVRPQSCAAATEDFLPPTVDDIHVDALLQQRFAKFDHFRRLEKLCDFTFMIGDSVFCVHKIILAASIPVFADLFLNPDQSNVLDYTVLNRLAPRAVQAVLRFAYSGVFDPTSAMQEEESNLRDIILAAKLFQVEKLEVACLDFLRQRLDFDVVQQYWSFAHANDLFELQEMLQSYACANFQEFIGTPAFLALTAAELEGFLVRDDLSVTNEDDIFRAIVSWVYNERAQRPSLVREVVNTGRSEAFPRLFSRLRLCKLSEDFAEQILSHPLCRAHFDCSDLTLETKLLRMTSMLKEQEVISRGAQFDRAYRELTTDVLFAVKRNNMDDESALVEIFNPIENNWQEFCSMHVRGNPKYVILNNRIYLIDGGSAQLSVEIFDIITKKSKRGAMGAPQTWSYSAVGIHDHILVLLEIDRSAIWWAYDTLSNKWKKGPKLGTPRRQSCLVTLQNRYVLLIGGRSSLFEYLRLVEYCEPGHVVANNDDDAFFRVVPAAGSTWTHPAPPLPETLVDVSAAELNGRVFVIGDLASNWSTIARTAVFTPQMGVDNGDGDDNSPRLGGQWFLLSPESSPPSLASSLVSHAGRLYLFGRDPYDYEVGVAQCFRPCSEEELENLRQEANERGSTVEGAASEVEANPADESPISQLTAASDNSESDEMEEDNVTTLPDSDPLSSWRWRPFCASDDPAHISFAGVINVTIRSGRK